MGVQQYLHQTGQRMEGSLPYPGRALQTHSDVLWINELASHFPNDDEYYIPTTSDARMVLHLHGRQSYPHQPANK